MKKEAKRWVLSHTKWNKKQLLIALSIKEAPSTRAKEREEEKQQQQYKKIQREAKLKKGIIAAKKEYMKSVSYLEMYNSLVC